MQVMDVVILTETFARRQPEVAGFHAASCLARPSLGAGRPSGGVSILYNNKLRNPNVLYAEDDCVVLVAERVCIVGIYVRPATVESTDIMLSKLNNCMDLIPPTSVIIMGGDFNARLEVAGSHRTKSLLEYCAEEGLWCANDHRVRTFFCQTGASTIDLFFSNLPPAHVQFNGSNHRLTSANGLTGHVPIAMTCGLSTSDIASVGRRAPPVPRSLQPQLFLEAVSPLFPVGEVVDIERYTSAITEAILRSARAAARSRPPPTRSKPWFNQDCSEARHRYLATRTDSSGDSSRLAERHTARLDYKRTLAQARMVYMLAEEEKLIKAAEDSPYKWTQQARPRIPCPVAPVVLTEYFSRMFASEDSVPRGNNLSIPIGPWPEDTARERAHRAPFRDPGGSRGHNATKEGTGHRARRHRQ